MVEAATRRNAEYIEAGKDEFIVADLEDFDPGDRRFDKILAIRVGIFHREPERANSLAKKWLAPGRELFAVFDPPNERKVVP
jgi:hypothetical protein